MEELVKHGLLSLRETLQTGDTLTAKNVSIGIVGENTKFEIIEGARLQAYVSLYSFITSIILSLTEDSLMA